MNDIIPLERIKNRIFLVRGRKIMLSTHLAELYGVEPKMLMRAVKRNIERFPEDFMFQLNNEEFVNLKYHFGTSSWGGIRYNPFAFTEQGVAMLSSVLRSPRAIEVNIQIMRAFVKFRELLSTYEELAKRLDEMEEKYDERFSAVFKAIKQLMTKPVKIPEGTKAKGVGFK